MTVPGPPSDDRRDRWRVWADTGGTFTDCIAVDPAGELHRAKVLSSGVIRARVRSCDDRGLLLDGVDAPPRAWAGFDLIDAATSRSVRIGAGGAVPQPWPQPGAPVELSTGEPAPVLAARLITGSPAGDPLPVQHLRLATTRGTNALLERTTEPTLLVVNSGFSDLLRIGDQRRPEIFALSINRPDPCYCDVLEVDGRLAVDGRELESLELESIETRARSISSRGIRAAAVALIHAWRNPAHERSVRDALLRAGFTHVTISSDLAQRIKLLPRAQTAVVNASLSSVIDEYVQQINESIGGARGRAGAIEIMTSSGGLTDSGHYLPKDSLLSGPAAGVAGAAAAGRRSGFDRIIAFDMGGTSTDVSRIDGDHFEYVFSHSVGGVEIMAPALAIESVAAGGGSICECSAGVLRVGPRSAGASPGPACYGRGGPLTVTDVNLLLGRLPVEGFGIPIDVAPARARLEALLDSLGQPDDPEAILEGMIDIANETMADAIRAISVRRGYDPSRYTLLAFGGAGGQHACAIAEQLGIDTVLVPEDASLLSAVGLGCTSAERILERQVLEPLPRVEQELPALIDQLVANGIERLRAEGAHQVRTRRSIVSLRFTGQEHSIDVEWDGEIDSLRRSFEERCRVIFGHVPASRTIEVECVRVVVTRASDHDQPRLGIIEPYRATSEFTQPVRLDGHWVNAPVLNRDELTPGASLDGPALVIEPRSTTLVSSGWRVEIDGRRALLLRRLRAAPSAGRGRPVAIRNELIANRIFGIGHEMGEMLRRTSISANVKERLDFSCAILDAGGRLIGSAPHIPVHLGALGIATRRLCEEVTPGEGDVIVTNHPAFGGSHLPDITLIAPVFIDGALVAFVANRAHHAELGGALPGSMPPGATSLADEGVVIPPTRLFDHGRPRWDEIEQVLRRAPYPSRAIDDNRADLAGSVAALRRGIDGLTALAGEHSIEHLHEAMDALTRRAASCVSARLPRIARQLSEFGFAEEIIEEPDDRSAHVRVRVGVHDGRLSIDFAGSSGVQPCNLNAPLAVTTSAVMYVVRLLLGKDAEGVPLNEGLLEPVDLHVPEGLLNPVFALDPQRCPPVAAGNVETSQRIVSALVRAFGLMAAGQGTMNNILFGNDRFGYYETVAGGAGAGPGFDGADAVHTHMTNTAITDVEVMERRYPVRVRRFGVRPQSGGTGRHRGGHGAVRDLEFLEQMSLSVVTQGRRVGGAGMRGGRPGAPGRQVISRADGSTLELPSIGAAEVAPGDILKLETPGGGAWGAPI